MTVRRGKNRCVSARFSGNIAAPDGRMPMKESLRLNDVFAYGRLPPSGGGGGFPATERHLKCIWFSPELRPAELRAENGEEVIIEKPGRWNLEKGPDFLDAVLRAGAARRRIKGDVEVHIHPADWQKHGHAADPAYARVIAHVTFFPGRLPSNVLPPSALQIVLRKKLLGNPLFSFESIDVAAYPFAARGDDTPCARILSRCSPGAVCGLLSAAGKHRLAVKAGRLAAAAEQKGRDQVLYEEIMGALGYKNNRLPFRLLAERVPLEALREYSGLNPVFAYALLAGVAGLLPALTGARWDDESRRFVRKLWNFWWKQRAEWSAQIIPAGLWSLSGVRPQNHPRRRLMAAADIFTNREMPSEMFGGPEVPGADAGRWIENILAVLQKPGDNYWRRRFVFGQKPSAADIALIGSRRAAAIVSNVIIPMQMGLRRLKKPPDDLLACLPVEEMNAVIRQSAFNLLGPDHNPSLYRRGLLQQGLIQIFHDFCLGDRSDCAACGLLEMISALKGEKHDAD